MNRIALAVAAISVFVLATGAAASAASSRSYTRVSDYSPSRSASGGGGRMTADLSAHYVRDTKPDGATDTAGRLSLGGMFGSWVGLDIAGMFAARSKDYLVGTDLRFAPTDWFFLKGGVGAYADKKTREFRLTPLAGTGVQAPLGDGYYLVSEFTYFERVKRKNVTFGAGLGVVF